MNRMTNLIVGLLLMAAGLLHADTYDRTWRFPTISIPRLDTAPKLDGSIGDEEWAKATLLPPALSRDPVRGNGLPSRYPTRVWMAYSPDALYVAWRQTLPPDELPVKATVTTRDACEGTDNTVVLWFSKNDQGAGQFNISGNAASATYDRRFDDGSLNYWNPKIEYVSKPTSTGFEGELKIPFAEIGVTEAPADGTKWAFYIYSSWRKTGSTLFSWPYAAWNARGEHALMVFGGNAPALRFRDDGSLQLAGSGAEAKTEFMRRKEKSPESYYQHLDTAMKVANVEGGTFQKFEDLVADSLKPFEPATKPEAPGEYLLRFDVKAGNTILAAGVQPFYKAPALDLEVTPFYLSAHKLVVGATAEQPQAVVLEASLSPVGYSAKGKFKAQEAEVEFPTTDLKEGTFEVAATAKDEQDKVIAKASATITKPAPPDWWTMKEGFTPRVPPPWTPVKASKNKVNVLLRAYEFANQAVPSRIETLGHEILAAPMEFRTGKPWEKSTVNLAKKDEEAAVYESVSIAGGMTLKVRTQVEFDGFMYVDLDITGNGSADKLDLVVPFKKEHATLMQSYCKASGPGDFAKGGGKPSDPKEPYKSGKRFVGHVPEKVETPPMLTTWIGTDKYGLEWSCESSRGWSMVSPNRAMEISTEGDRVTLTVHLISREVKLSSDKPRHIRFGLVATPTKTILPYMQHVRIFDDWYPALLPGDWSGHPCWHAPVKDPKVIEKETKWIEGSRKAGTRIGVNGGWNISTDVPEWDTWGKEMIAEPLQNVSFGNVKQFACCYRTPYAAFMANSFAYNARLLKFDGIRFDTVVPSYECQSLVHGCGWYDDDGKLWPSFSTFEAREIWKRLYRTFHGGVRPEGVIWTPVAAGPIMAVHSFSDIQEIGESYYEKAKTIKDGYPPDMIRANMTGIQYGLIAQSNIKGLPLRFNQRNAALLVNGSTPRFTDYRFWRPDYSAQSNPAINIWDAWDWVDRWNADWQGWWENAGSVSASCQVPGIEKPVLLASYWWNRKSNRVLLIATNYETEPMAGATIKFDIAKLGLKGKLYGEDAVTLEPVAIGADGTVKLDFLPERYRLIKISNEPPRFRDETLGEKIATGAPAEIKERWSSKPIQLEANSRYVLKALVKIDKPLGAEIEGSNRDLWSMSNYASIYLSGQGIGGINGSNKLALCPLKGSEEMVPYSETDNYKRGIVPQLWEKTPGWATVFIPYSTSTNAATGQIEVGFAGAKPGEAVFKDVTLQKVTAK